MPQSGAPTRISGQTIIDELIRNMELGRLEMGYSILLPCIFSVYLHPDDYARLAPVSRSSSRRCQAGAQCAHGGMERQEPAVPPRRYPQDLQDRAERLVDRTLRRHRGRRSAGRRGDPLGVERRPAARLSRRQDHPDRPRAIGDFGARGARPRKPHGASSDRVFAEIRYQDDSGPQTYFVTQNEISIGRGGEDLWVDLPLYANEEVSREHLRLRRDPASGAFTIVDKSRNGTWLNGRKLTRGVEEPVPDRAEIRVAEVVKLSFEVRR